MASYLRLFSSQAAQEGACKGVVITGGSRGLGFSLAGQFLSRGSAVVVTATTISGAERAAEALREVHGSCAQVHGCACDVRDWRQVDALAEFARQRLPEGVVDCWINNAGLSTRAKRPLDEADPDELAAIVDTNLLGSLLGSRAALRLMKQQPEGGKIFCIDGTGAWGNPTPGNCAYGATKRALTQLKASLVAETKGTAVSFHLASPGMVATDLLLKGIDNPRSAKFVNILAEPADDVAAWLVPRMVAARGNGQYIKFLRPPGVLWRFMTAGRRRNRFLDEAAFLLKGK